jgi:hypothetical protein
MTTTMRLKLLGWAHVALAALGLALGAYLTLGTAFSGDPRADEALAWIVPIFIAAQLFWLLPGLVGGLGLVAGQGWAKGPLTFVSVLMLTFIPVGTILGAVSLWLLYSRDARDAAASAARRPMSNSLKLALCVIAAIASLGLIVGLGWIFRDVVEDFPRPNRLVFGVMIGVTVLGVFAFSMLTRGRRITLNPLEIQRRIEAEARQRETVKAHHFRITQLRADPVRARFADLIEVGDYWTDEAISYALDPAATATCEHLVSIERAMRGEGVVVKPTYSAAVVEARCDIDEARLQAEFQPAATVSFSRFIEAYERSYEDPPNAALRCSACNSGIWTTPTHEIKPTTPVFPRRKS